MWSVKAFCGLLVDSYGTRATIEAVQVPFLSWLRGVLSSSCSWKTMKEVYIFYCLLLRLQFYAFRYRLSWKWRCSIFNKITKVKTEWSPDYQIIYFSIPFLFHFPIFPNFSLWWVALIRSFSVKIPLQQALQSQSRVIWIILKRIRALVNSRRWYGIAYQLGRSRAQLILGTWKNLRRNSVNSLPRCTVIFRELL